MILEGFGPIPDSKFLVYWVLVACSGCSDTTINYPAGRFHLAPSKLHLSWSLVVVAISSSSNRISNKSSSGNICRGGSSSVYTVRVTVVVLLLAIVVL